MIGILAFLKRKRVDMMAKSAPPEEEARQRLRKAARLVGGAYERTQDLLAGHDGERIGFRKPLQG